MEARSRLTPAKANLSFSNGNIPGLAGFPVVGKAPKRISRDRPGSRLLLHRDRMRSCLQDQTLVESGAILVPKDGKKKQKVYMINTYSLNPDLP